MDSQDSIITAMATTFISNGLERPDASDIRRVIGLPLDEAMMQLNSGVSRADADGLSQVYKTLFRKMRQDGQVHEPLFPGVCQTLSELDRADWTLGIATGKASHGLVATLEPHGILDYFVTRQTSDVAKGKPDPEMVLRAMKETDTPPETTVMIGDTTFDMEMARNAGVLAVGVSWGYHKPDELYQSGAKIVIDKLEDFESVLTTVMEDGQ